MTNDLRSDSSDASEPRKEPERRRRPSRADDRKRESWTKPLLGLLAGVVAVSGTWYTAYRQGQASVAVEKERTAGSVQIARQESDTTITVEQKKRETELILKALDAGSDVAVRQRLLFLVEAGLIRGLDPEAIKIPPKQKVSSPTKRSEAPSAQPTLKQTSTRTVRTDVVATATTVETATAATTSAAVPSSSIASEATSGVRITFSAPESSKAAFTINGERVTFSGTTAELKLAVGKYAVQWFVTGPPEAKYTVRVEKLASSEVLLDRNLTLSDKGADAGNGEITLQ